MNSTRKLAVGALAIALVAAVAPAVGSARGAAPDPRAVAYYTSHQATVYQVEAYLLAVQRASRLLAKTRSRANASKLVALSSQAANWIDVHLGRLAPADSGGPLGAAERDVLAGAGGLRDALGTLGTYLQTPKPSTSALFLRQYGAAAAHWNRGVSVIWRLAQKGPLPVVPNPL